MIRSRILGPAVAALLATAGILLLPLDTSEAAPVRAVAAQACPGVEGITVVVDFNQLPAGDEVQVGCDRNGGGRARSNFTDAGFTLTDHPTQSDYICQVNGRPANQNCIENDAFWSLWWSDGKSGKWIFSNRGATGLKVPTGGYVAFAWHEGGGTAGPPDVKPTPRTTPSTKPSPTAGSGSTAGNGKGSGGKGSGSKGSGGTGTQGGKQPDRSTASGDATPTGPSASATPSTSPSATADQPTTSSPSTSSSAVPGAGEITAGPETDTAHLDGGDDDGSFPTWLAVGLGVGVLGAAGAVPLIRRRLG